MDSIRCCGGRTALEEGTEKRVEIQVLQGGGSTLENKKRTSRKLLVYHKGISTIMPNVLNDGSRILKGSGALMIFPEKGRDAHPSLKPPIQCGASRLTTS